MDIWDLKKTTAPLLTINAHIQNVQCLDWHHSLEDVFITGSYDRFIKIWNIKDAYSNSNFRSGDNNNNFTQA